MALIKFKSVLCLFVFISSWTSERVASRYNQNCVLYVTTIFLHKTSKSLCWLWLFILAAFVFFQYIVR